jgi:hypothetical protein
MMKIEADPNSSRNSSALPRPRRVALFSQFPFRMVRALLLFCFLMAATAATSVSALAQQRSALRSAIAITRVDSNATVALGGDHPFQEPRRRSEGGRLALQFLAASAGAVGGGLGTYLLLRDVSETRVQGDEGYTRSGNVGYLVGSFAGATLGAHAVGTSMGGRAPLWATSLGALVGTVPLIAVGVDEPYLPLFGIAIGWLPQGALAAGGFVMGQSR